LAEALTRIVVTRETELQAAILRWGEDLFNFLLVKRERSERLTVTEVVTNDLFYAHVFESQP